MKDCEVTQEVTSPRISRLELSSDEVHHALSHRISFERGQGDAVKEEIKRLEKGERDPRATPVEQETDHLKHQAVSEHAFVQADQAAEDSSKVDSTAMQPEVNPPVASEQPAPTSLGSDADKLPATSEHIQETQKQSRDCCVIY